MNSRFLVLYAVFLGLLSTNSAISADACYTASKTYQIRPLHGGGDKRDGWTVEGNAFAQCVHRAEAADKALRTRYPETHYALSLAATIGCHSPCG